MNHLRLQACLCWVAILALTLGRGVLSCRAFFAVGLVGWPAGHGAPLSHRSQSGAAIPTSLAVCWECGGMCEIAVTE